VLTVPAGKQRLEFRFTGLYFSAPERVCYRYQLEGLDADWVESGTATAAYYSYVPPGSYRFRVTAHNGNGVWNEAGAVLALSVLPHYWQTWWFRVAAWLASVAAASGVLAAVLRRRHELRIQALERQRAIERERSRIAQDMHDELGSRLTKAGMVTEMVRRELGASPARQQRLETLRDTPQEMTVTMDELVRAVNPRHDTLDGLANYVVRFTQEFFADTDIQCLLNVPADLPAVPLTAQIRHNLFLAFKEALNNAAKHAAATEVSVRVKFAAGRLLLEVADNGIGFAADRPHTGGRGLANMRDRLNAIGGSCDIESKAGAGTRVLLKAPLSS
jgi:signal transduction histidine kinase